ncbi:MAG: hypothetical protein JNM56_08375 [Planctomycetia bacterium]|nr:hypothetical protein [Planctomycetia bacterium]
MYCTAAGLVRAGDDCCDHCGHEGHCRKVCRLICEDKKVEITCWGKQTEDFCVPKPSKPLCKHKEKVCEDCGADDKGQSVKSGPRKFAWYEWQPRGAKTFTRHKLMKKTITKTIPSYRWVVEIVCDECDAHCTSVKPEAGAVVPPPPAVPGAEIKRPAAE